MDVELLTNLVLKLVEGSPQTALVRGGKAEGKEEEGLEGGSTAVAVEADTYMTNTSRLFTTRALDDQDSRWSHASGRPDDGGKDGHHG